VLGLACDAQRGQRQRRITVLGLSSRHRLTTPMQADGTPIDVPAEGLVMTRKLADLLNVGVDDQLDLTPVRGWRHTVHARVASIVEGYIGLGCYADIRYLSRVVGEALAVNSVQLAVDPRKTTALFRAIKKLPNAQDLTVRRDTVQNIESTFVQNMYITLTLMIVFAGVISLGTMLNSSLVEIGERARDIATFRVLGYRSNQVAGIFFRQNMVIFVAGLLLALPLGLGMTSGIARVYDTELFRMPVVMRLRTVFYSALTAVAFVLVAQWFVYRTIRRLDWLENVKVKE
jgi:putative ABC transport system permease protein